MKRFAGIILALSATVVVGGCTSVPLTEAGTLSSYERLGAATGNSTKSRTFIDAQSLTTVSAVRIEPTKFSAGAEARIASPADRALVANAIDRSLCIGLSDGYRIVSWDQPADLTVRAVVTDIVPTDRTAAGVSKAASLGTSLVLPVGLPRLPYGLGGLAVEAEAMDRDMTQRAAAVWSRGANSITNGARVSEVGDAYSLASSFGNYFSRMLVTKRVPAGLNLSPPSGQRIQSALGARPKYDACEAFGRSPGVAGAVAARFGAPPNWTDRASGQPPVNE
jgi:hypothetical protein